MKEIFNKPIINEAKAELIDISWREIINHHEEAFSAGWEFAHNLLEKNGKKICGGVRLFHILIKSTDMAELFKGKANNHDEEKIPLIYDSLDFPPPDSIEQFILKWEIFYREDKEGKQEQN